MSRASEKIALVLKLRHLVYSTYAACIGLMSRSFGPKVEIAIRDPTGNFHLERGTRRELENKFLVGALACWHYEIDRESSPRRVAAHEISCAQGFGIIANASNPPS